MSILFNRSLIIANPVEEVFGFIADPSNMPLIMPDIVRSEKIGDGPTEVGTRVRPGDSAGPAFLKIEDTYYRAGVGSAQSTQATGGIEGLYGVTEYYVRVSTFIDWIEKTISEE